MKGSKTWRRTRRKQHVYGESTVLFKIQLNVNLSGQLRDIAGVSKVDVKTIRQCVI